MISYESYIGTLKVLHMNTCDYSYEENPGIWTMFALHPF